MSDLNPGYDDFEIELIKIYSQNFSDTSRVRINARFLGYHFPEMKDEIMKYFEYGKIEKSNDKF